MVLRIKLLCFGTVSIILNEFKYFILVSNFIENPNLFLYVIVLYFLHYKLLQKIYFNFKYLSKLFTVILIIFFLRV